MFPVPGHASRDDSGFRTLGDDIGPWTLDFPWGTIARMSRPARLPSALAAGLLLAAWTPALQEPEAELIQKIRDLIIQLRERHPGTRQKAEDDLFSLGMPALPIIRVEEARLTQGDLKFRLGVIIKRIEKNHRKNIALGNTLLVTLSVKDRPIRDVLDDLEQMTSVPIEQKGIPADAATTLDVKGVSLWEAIDQICGAHGKLAWDVSEKGVSFRREAYVRPFMATASGYLLIARPFLRYPPGPGSGDRDYVRSDMVIAGAPGAASVSQYVTYDALVDDKGTNLLTTPSGLAAATSIGGYRLLADPAPDRPLFRIPFDVLDGAPARGSTRFKTCKGTAVLHAVLEAEIRVDLRGTFLKKGARGEGFGLVLEVDTLEISPTRVRMEVSITDTRVVKRKEERIFYPQNRGKIVLRDAAGKEIASEAEQVGPVVESGKPVSKETTRFKVQAALKDGATLNAVEVWEATYVEAIKIAFDFKDVPMKKMK
jgi:hypothetical protein